MALDNLWVWPMPIHLSSNIYFHSEKLLYFLVLYITKIVYFVYNNDDD